MPLYVSLTNRLRNQYESMEIIVSTANPDGLQMRPQPGKWNAHDHIAHLARYQSIFADRIQQILNNEEVFFGRYVAEEDEYSFKKRLQVYRKPSCQKRSHIKNSLG